MFYFSTVNISNFNVLIDGRNIFGQSIGYQIRKYDEIRKNTIEQGDDYTTGYLLDCIYYKDH